MKRPVLAMVLFALLGTSPASAQMMFLGPGSTFQGDYLRGVGVAAFGEAMYVREEAIANSINTDTMMRLNEYIYSCYLNGEKRYREMMAARVERDNRLFHAIQDRILKSPEARDVQTGDALNVLLERLNGPLVSESALRYEAIPLTVEEVKRIPFKLAEKGVKSFSMRRLTAKGTKQMPIAFQDDRYTRELRAYELAIDTALEQQYKGRMQDSAIIGLERAVDALDYRLKEVHGVSADRRYTEARDRLKEMRDVIEMLKSLKIEQALGALDRYSGSTVNDLRVFMRNHNLQFADASTPEEKNLFPELYTKLKMQLEKVTGREGVPEEAVNQ